MPLCRATAVVCVLACLTQSYAASTWAQAWPAKPIRVVVASSAGSNPDTIARVAAAGLTPVLGQQVLVDDRPGAGGNIGAEVAARAPADGYTVFLAHTNHSVNASLYQKLNYDLMTDFAPVSLVALSAFVATVHPSLPVKSLRDLINIARARPGDLTYASAGTGSGTYFSAEYFNALANVKMLHVAYNGGGPALASVVSGETSIYFTPYATGLPHMQSGKLRALGVTAPKRLADLPNVPAIAETLPGYEVMAWAGFMLPVKTPRPVAEALHKATVTALANPDVARRFRDLGFIVVGSRPDEMSAYTRAEIDRYAKLIRQIGLKPQ